MDPTGGDQPQHVYCLNSPFTHCFCVLCTSLVCNCASISSGSLKDTAAGNKASETDHWFKTRHSAASPQQSTRCQIALNQSNTFKGSMENFRWFKCSAYGVEFANRA